MMFYKFVYRRLALIPGSESQAERTPGEIPVMKLRFAVLAISRTVYRDINERGTFAHTALLILVGSRVPGLYIHRFQTIWEHIPQ